MDPGIPDDQERDLDREVSLVAAGRVAGEWPTLGKSSQAAEDVETIVAMMSTFLNCVFLLL